MRASFTRLCAGSPKLCDFIVIDSPGGDSFLARTAHAWADTLVTPLNDSFVDFDLLGDIDPNCADIVRPSIYSEMVWDSRKKKALAIKTPIDWVVLRNRTSASRIEAKNKQRVGEALRTLSSRIGFRLAPGLSERVVYRELFPQGLTMLDLDSDERKRRDADGSPGRPPGTARPLHRPEASGAGGRAAQVLRFRAPGSVRAHRAFPAFVRRPGWDGPARRAHSALAGAAC